MKEDQINALVHALAVYRVCLEEITREAKPMIKKETQEAAADFLQQLEEKYNAHQEPQYYLMDLERTLRGMQPTFWKAARRGYTKNLEEAGRYGEKEALTIARDDNDGTTIPLKLEKVEKILKGY